MCLTFLCPSMTLAFFGMLGKVPFPIASLKCCRKYGVRDMIQTQYDMLKHWHQVDIDVYHPNNHCRYVTILRVLKMFNLISLLTVLTDKGVKVNFSGCSGHFLSTIFSVGSPKLRHLKYFRSVHDLEVIDVETLKVFSSCISVILIRFRVVLLKRELIVFKNSYYWLWISRHGFRDDLFWLF